jgi:hypothetical protein
MRLDIVYLVPQRVFNEAVYIVLRDFITVVLNNDTYIGQNCGSSVVIVVTCMSDCRRVLD